jgi:hypothetical protein
MFNIRVKYFFVVLAMPTDNGQYWPGHIKTNFYMPILYLLKLMDIVIHSCVEKRTGSICHLQNSNQHSNDHGSNIKTGVFCHHLMWTVVNKERGCLNKKFGALCCFSQHWCTLRKTAQTSVYLNHSGTLFIRRKSYNLYPAQPIPWMICYGQTERTGTPAVLVNI